MKCSYCSMEIPRGTGIMYVYKTGAIAYYCSNSHFKNHVKMGRKISKKLLERPVKKEKK